MARVRVSQLSKWYGKHPGLHPLDMETKEGEFRVIFGPAGAGKTTTLNLLAGIVPQTGGSVYIDDRCVDNVEPAGRNMAMVFESYALYPNLNVFDNMAFPLRSPRYRKPEAEIREEVSRLSETMGIGHLLKRRIQELSNGQRQRVALGRALIRQPDVFLLDEPLSHLDAKLRHSMRAEFKEMREEMDTTTFYVTHDYLEALSLADRITVLSSGQVLQDGTPDEVFFFPASSEVASLFGDPEINLLPGKVEMAENGAPGVRIFANADLLPLPEEILNSLPRHKEVLVGIRPADVLLGDGTESPVFSGRVYSHEPLGAQAIVTIEAGNQLPLVRSLVRKAVRYVPDERIEFSLRRDALLFFDRETKRLCARSGTAPDIPF